MTKAERCEVLRYRKPALESMSYYDVTEGLDEIENLCGDVHWWIDNEQDFLINALDDNEDDAFNFRMAFSDIENDCYRLRESLQESVRNAYLMVFRKRTVQNQKGQRSVLDAAPGTARNGGISMTRSEYRLKSCPFCGNQAKLVKTWDGLHRAECSRCSCQTVAYPTMIAAVRRWNQRVLDKPSGWISCDAHLPENSAPCLVVCRTWSMTENAWKEGTLMILRYLPKEHRWDIGGMTDVTYWMPMPEFPEE